MWKTVKLGDVCTISNGGTPKSKIKNYWDGGVQWLTPKDMGKLSSRYVSETERQISREGLNNSSAKLIPKNSVILSCRAPIGHVAINESDMSFNQGCKGLVPSEKIIVEYLYYFLVHSKQLLNDLGKGAVFKEISAKTLNAVEVPLPPLAEQQRIVAKLDAAFAEIEKLSATQSSKLRETDTLIASALDKMLTQHDAAEKSVELQSLCESNRGITYGVIKLGEEVENGIPCLRTSNVRKRKIVTNGMKRIAGELSREYERTILNGGEVLVNVRGTLGGVSVVPEAMAGWNISREVAMVPIDTCKASADYISLWISSPMSEKWLHGNTRGAAYQGINLSDLRKLPVALPAREVQDELVLQFEKLQRQIDTMKEELETAMNDIATLKSAILNQELEPPQSEAA